MGHNPGGRRPGQPSPPTKTVSEPQLLAVQTADGTLQVSAHLPPSVRPERSFSADCGVVRRRHESPEFHFAQLDPADPSRAVRRLVVRMEEESFEAQRKDQTNVTFIDNMEERRRTRYKEPGKFSTLAEEARPASESPVVLVDAVWVLLATVGQRGSMIFLSASTGEVAAVARGRVAQARLVPELEVTMSASALIDICRSWQNLNPETSP